MSSFSFKLLSLRARLKAAVFGVVASQAHRPEGELVMERRRLPRGGTVGQAPVLLVGVRRLAESARSRRLVCFHKADARMLVSSMRCMGRFPGEESMRSCALEV
jgi:hypothetical protein